MPLLFLCTKEMPALKIGQRLSFSCLSVFLWFLEQGCAEPAEGTQRVFVRCGSSLKKNMFFLAETYLWFYSDLLTLCPTPEIDFLG